MKKTKFITVVSHKCNSCGSEDHETENCPTPTQVETEGSGTDSDKPKSGDGSKFLNVATGTSSIITALGDALKGLWGNSSNQKPGDITNNTEDKETKETNNTALFVVAGVAVLALVLVLFFRRK